jgi:type VI secretion system secreted protein Hcp
MAIYMNFKARGKEIQGDVTQGGFENWIELRNVSFACSREVAMDVGQSMSREGGVPRVQSITVSKELDSATPMLIYNALSNAEPGEAMITFVRTGDDEQSKIGHFKLEKAIISDYSFAGSMGERPSEQLSISFSKIEADFSGADKSNKNGKNIIVSYDLKTAVAQ